MGDDEQLESADDRQILPEPSGPALDPVEPAYRTVIRVRLGILWVGISTAAVVLDQILLPETGFHGLPSTLVPLVGISSVAVVPQRVYRRLGYRVTERFMQVVRGWMFRTDTMVPFVRVQHIDITRGPVEKMFGIATLVVHTAGTHNSIVTVPGLSPETAARIRDTIREHVRTDFE